MEVLARIRRFVLGNATIGRGIGAEGASNAAMRALFETSGIASSGPHPASSSGISQEVWVTKHVWKRSFFSAVFAFFSL
jgi:hypothetical protein